MTIKAQLRIALVAATLTVIAAGARAQAPGCGGASADWIAGCTAIIDKRATPAPERALALRIRGIAHFKRGDFDEAIVDFSASLALDPKNAAVYVNRAAAFERRFDLAAALADYNSAAALDPKQPWIFLERGKIYKAKHDPVHAREDFDEAIRLAPGSHVFAAAGTVAQGAARPRRRRRRFRQSAPAKPQQHRGPARARRYARRAARLRQGLRRLRQGACRRRQRPAGRGAGLCGARGGVGPKRRPQARARELRRAVQDRARRPGLPDRARLYRVRGRQFRRRRRQLWQLAAEKARTRSIRCSCALWRALAWASTTRRNCAAMPTRSTAKPGRGRWSRCISARSSRTIWSRACRVPTKPGAHARSRFSWPSTTCCITAAMKPPR